ncbi:MAG: tetratricopeptide repeat protein [Actinobacteria bacterium]|nr:tetratricopeptide repeat protein [Actinomycetota bacterium]
MDDTPRREPAFQDESEAYSLFQRGIAFLREQHPAQAAMLLEQALRLEPGKNSIREALGRAEFTLGMHEQAAVRFRDVLGDAPDNDYAQYALGRCLLKLGLTDEARAHLRLARALRPQSDLYREALSALE